VCFLTPNSPFTFDNIVRAVVTFAILGSALFLVLFRPDSPPTDRWAYSTIMFVAGYWLRGQSRSR
jgi:hypothetical protein